MTQRTAGVMVQVFSINLPGKVVIEVVDCGPEPLTRPETIRVLRDALAVLERQELNEDP